MKDSISKLPLLSHQEDLLKLEKNAKAKKQISGFLGSDWLLFWASISKTCSVQGFLYLCCCLHELSNRFSFCLSLSLLSLSC